MLLIADTNEKELPRNTGTFLLAEKWKIIVPRPALSRAIDGLKPVIMGTSTLDPIIAKVCWRPNKAFNV